MNETVLNQQIIAYLNSLPYTYAFKHFGAGRGGYRSQAGISDILCCHNGLWVSFEGKVGSNQPSIAQKKFIDNIIMAKGEAHIVRSLQDAIDVIEGMQGAM